VASDPVNWVDLIGLCKGCTSRGSRGECNTKATVVKPNSRKGQEAINSWVNNPAHENAWSQLNDPAVTGINPFVTRTDINFHQECKLSICPFDKPPESASTDQCMAPAGPQMSPTRGDKNGCTCLIFGPSGVISY